MNPGLVVKLRPAGPWRIGPDSGARNKVDAIYHSDSLYAAVTSAMARLGSLADWLDATARNATTEVCFSSCFPFLDEIGFVPPPRTVWPPSSPSSMGARVRWKSARFVPLGIVQAILAGHRLNDDQWTVDVASECLVPAGRQGPFRTSVRWNAAVDRMTGVTERHSTACLEFQPGAGLWTVVSFREEAARARWLGPVQAAFRWLADSGFGGERSRGWGRSETPEFVEGMLPEMILGTAALTLPTGSADRRAGAIQDAAAAAPEHAGQSPSERLTSVPPVQSPLSSKEPAPVSPVEEPPSEEPAPVPPVEEPPSEEPVPVPPVEEPPSEEPAPVPPVEEPPSEEPAPVPPVEEPPSEKAASVPPVEEPPSQEPPDRLGSAMPSVPESAIQAAQRHSSDIAGTPGSLAPGPRPLAPENTTAEPSRPPAPGHAHWLLSLFAPASDDSVDWARGNYTILTRSGRVDASGELKKQLTMISEGSVVYSPAAPRGSAPNVAPDGFVHPVFRAGFAVSIPLPEVLG